MTIARDFLLFRYDNWLELYGVAGRDRKELKRELKANLMEAEAAGGWPAARAGVGSVRDLARENAEAVRDPRRPAWGPGVTAAVCVFSVVVLWLVWTMLAYADGVFASKLALGESIEAPVTLLPGSHFGAGRNADGSIWTSAHVSPWLVVLPVVATFLVVARVWRPFTHRKG